MTAKLMPVLILALLPLSAGAAANCRFDVDSADRLDFAERIVDCEEPAAEREKTAVQLPLERLYSDQSVPAQPLIREHRVVAPGSLNHTAGQRFEAREEYSLRADAAFEASVTFAIQRLHLQMAHHCSRGWRIEGQRSDAKQDIRDPLRSGKYFLYYQFTCAANG